MVAFPALAVLLLVLEMQHSPELVLLPVPLDLVLQQLLGKLGVMPQLLIDQLLLQVEAQQEVKV